jgi:hypothetical protein
METLRFRIGPIERRAEPDALDFQVTKNSSPRTLCGGLRAGGSHSKSKRFALAGVGQFF